MARIADLQTKLRVLRWCGLSTADGGIGAVTDLPFVASLIFYE
jgi:hypothetical protein